MRAAQSAGNVAVAQAVPVAAPAAAPRPMAAPAAAPVAGASVSCPRRGPVTAPSTKFCASCGYNRSLVAAAPPAAAAAPTAAAPAAAAAAPAPGRGQVMLTALRADGTEAGTFPLRGPVITIGRDVGGIFAGDSYLSPRHATFSVRGSKLFVKDELSLNGVYLKLAPESSVELQSGDVFRIGQEIIRFELLTPQPPGADGVERLGSPSKGYIGRMSLLTGRDTTGNAYPVPEHGIHIGRERGDILFPEDGYVSGLHCRLSWENGHAFLTDLVSSNGTFSRIYKERELLNNDVLLMRQQLFRIGF